MATNPHLSDTDISRAAKAVREADALLISASAGMGVDSGGMLIRINPLEADIPHGGVGLLTTAADGIQRICKRL